MDAFPFCRMHRYTRTPFSIMYLLHDVVLLLLSVRFVLALTDSIMRNEATHFLYKISQPLAEPFRDMFPASMVAGVQVEWYTFVAAATVSATTILLLQLLALLTRIADDDQATAYRHHRHA